MHGLDFYGYGAWAQIADKFVLGRNRASVRKHGVRFFGYHKRVKEGKEKKKMEGKQETANFRITSIAGGRDLSQPDFEPLVRYFPPEMLDAVQIIEKATEEELSKEGPPPAVKILQDLEEKGRLEDVKTAAAAAAAVKRAAAETGAVPGAPQQLQMEQDDDAEEEDDDDDDDEEEDDDDEEEDDDDEEEAG